MFSKSLDSKGRYFVDGVEVVDLADSIFDPGKSASHLYTMYKVSKEYTMRPDLLSKALYGTTDYTEMLLKYSLINNPFSIEEDDMILSSSLTTIYQAVKDTDYQKTLAFDAVKNYHKYIDKNKVPDSPGSEKIPEKTSNVEANITKTGNNGITVKDGKIYFGAVEDSVTATDSPIVDCAVNGTTLGEFLNATIRNTQ